MEVAQPLIITITRSAPIFDLRSFRALRERLDFGIDTEKT